METKETKISFWKNVLTTKSIARGAIIVLVAFMAWYQFGGAEKSVFTLLRSDTTALVHSARTFLASSLSFGDAKLSTGAVDEGVAADQISATWQFQAAQNGESIWTVYRDELKGNTEVAFRTQVINGLKNITILQNNISDQNIRNNSLTAGKEYSFLNADAIDHYAGKVKEANEKLHDGTKLSDLSPDLQLAYRIANAPSYQFLHSLSQDTIHSVYE